MGQPLRTKRRRIPPAGACDCDVFTTAHSVRKLRLCAFCKQPGIKLITLRRSPHLIHPRCVFYLLPLDQAIHELVEAIRGQAMMFALCCLGDYSKEVFGLAWPKTAQERRP